MIVNDLDGTPWVYSEKICLPLELVVECAVASGGRYETHRLQYVTDGSVGAAKGKGTKDSIASTFLGVPAPPTGAPNSEGKFWRLIEKAEKELTEWLKGQEEEKAA